MTFNPTSPASGSRASQINRVAKIQQRDLVDPAPDTLTLIKREVNTLDLLAVSSPSTYATRIAAITNARARQMFQGGNKDKLRWRFYVYGLVEAILLDVLKSLFAVNYPKVGAWFRLGSSTSVGGEWPDVVDLFSTSDMVQPGAVRKPAVGSSTAGLPTMVFDGTDVMTIPLTAQNNATTAFGISMWALFANPTGATQAIHSVTSSGLSGSASVNRHRFTCTSAGKLQLDVFTSGANGRTFTATTTTLPVGSKVNIRVQYDSTLASEADLDGLTTNAKVRIFQNEVALALTATNLGTGGTIGALLSATGSGTLGAASDSDTPLTPLLNNSVIFSDVLFWNATPTSAEAIAAMNVEAP